MCMTAFIGKDSSICVKCSFINGSNALGCEVEFRDRITDECLPCIRYTIFKLSNSLIASKCFNHTSEGNFSVVAYDKVSNNTSDIRAAVYNELQEYLLVPVENFYFKTSPLVYIFWHFYEYSERYTCLYFGFKFWFHGLNNA